MSIVKMKKLRLCGLLSERDELLDKLQFLGSVEISDISDRAYDPEYQGLVSTDESAINELRALDLKLVSALEILNKYSPKKSGLFPKKRIVSKDELFDKRTRELAESVAESLRHDDAEISRFYSEESRLRALIASFQPWSSLDLPLQTTETKETAIVFGTLPFTVNLRDFENALYAAADASELFAVSSDRDQHYLMLVYHKSAADGVNEVIRNFGFSRSSFNGYSGTAKEIISMLDNELRICRNNIMENIDEIKSLESGRESLRLCIDKIEIDLAKESAKLDIMSTEKAFALEGWVEAPMADKTVEVLRSYCCAYELSDPTEDDIPQVPVKLRDGPLSSPLNMVTEMYSLPAYDGIDPNPLIMPFFTIFFGIMYADLGYGITLMLISLFVCLKFSPEGTVGNLFKLMGECGFWSAVAGLFTGAFFGNAIVTIAGMFGKEITSLPGVLNYLVNPIVDPMSDPLTVLILAMVIGCIQIVTGMAIKAYMLIRDGHFWDAVFDIGSWWLLFAGIGVGAATGNWYTAIAGVAALVLTQGRAKKGLFAKLFGGIASLYDITSYFGDVLSYSRLMTLLLAGGVIATIVNMLGSMTGNIFIFAIIFVIGHVFNMGINIIGTYVHSARLQYLEFFGKFYKEGGKPFAPLKIKTNYVSLKEEK